MVKYIPTEIQKNELLVRFITTKLYKRNKLNEKEMFMPYKEGVSLQRGVYSKEQDCKNRGKKLGGRYEYVGFSLFTKEAFELVKLDYIKNERAEFQAKIKSTPIDFMGKTIELTNKDEFICLKTYENPCHADLIYINPAPRENETPKTAIRSFGRKLARVCRFIEDPHPQQQEYLGEKFILKD